MLQMLVQCCLMHDGLRQLGVEPQCCSHLPEWLLQNRLAQLQLYPKRGTAYLGDAKHLRSLVLDAMLH